MRRGEEAGGDQGVGAVGGNLAYSFVIPQPNIWIGWPLVQDLHSLIDHMVLTQCEVALQGLGENAAQRVKGPEQKELNVKGSFGPMEKHSALIGVNVL